MIGAYGRTGAGGRVGRGWGRGCAWTPSEAPRRRGGESDAATMRSWRRSVGAVPGSRRGTGAEGAPARGGRPVRPAAASGRIGAASAQARRAAGTRSRRPSRRGAGSTQARIVEAPEPSPVPPPRHPRHRRCGRARPTLWTGAARGDRASFDDDPGSRVLPGSADAEAGSRCTAGYSWVTSAASLSTSGSAAGSARRGRGGGTSALEAGSGAGSAAAAPRSAPARADRGRHEPARPAGTYATDWSTSPGSASNARRGRVTRPVFQSAWRRAQGCDAFHPESTPSDPAKWFPDGDRWPTVDSIGITNHPREDFSSMQTLYRPRDDRLIAGVCSGIARRFGIDPTIVRILFVASLLLPGPQILIYLAAWVLMPEESSTLAIAPARALSPSRAPSCSPTRGDARYPPIGLQNQTGVYAAASGCAAASFSIRPAPPRPGRRRCRSGRAGGSRQRPGQPGPRPAGVVRQPVQQVVVPPRSRIASATATACSLITSWAVSRPTPCRTAATSTLVVTRNGRYRRARPRSPPGTRRTRPARSGTSRTARRGRRRRPAGRPGGPPSGHVALVPLVAGQLADHRDVAAEDHRQPLTRSQDRVFILCGIALEPTWPGWNPSVTSSCPAISRIWWPGWTARPPPAPAR